MSESTDDHSIIRYTQPSIARKTLERLSLVSDSRDLVVEEVTIAPGAAAPLHSHSVSGIVYIIDGVAESAYGDDPPRRYRTGDTLQDRTDVSHTLFRNCDPNRPLRFLAIYALEPGGTYLKEH